MLDARELFGQVMQGGMSRSTQSRLGHAIGPQGLGAGGNPLSDLLGGLGQGGAGGLGGLADTARDMLGGAGRAAKRNPFAVGGLAALAGAILGGKTAFPAARSAAALWRCSRASLGRRSAPSRPRAAAGRRRAWLAMRRSACASRRRPPRRRSCKARPT